MVVTTPEEMPIVESAELVEKVRRTTDVDVAGVFVNRMLSQWFEGRDLEVFDALADPAAQAVLAEALGAAAGEVFAAARLAQARHLAAEEHLARLVELLPDDVPVHQVPELYTKASGRRVVSLLADELEAVIG